MKRNILVWTTCFILLAGLARAKDDSSIVVKFDHNGPKDPLSVASVYLSFQGDKAEGLPGVASGDETRYSLKVWEGLFLQVTTETGEEGVEGYHFAFSKDEAFQTPLAMDEPAQNPILRDLAASDFRSEDNSASRTIKPGPGTPKDRGILRVLHYPGFNAEIRVLEYNIGDAEEGKSPYFKSVSCLVTVKQKEQSKSPVTKTEEGKNEKTSK